MPRSGRERWILRGVGVLTVALVAIVAVSLLSTGASSRHGCVHATFAGPVGAEQLDACGARARAICGALGTPSGYTGDAARSLAGECRKAGLRAGT